MNKEQTKEYEKYKLRVKVWENDFKKDNKRIPSKYDIKDAPIQVKQAYKMYYRIKTTFLSQSMTDILDDDDEFEADELSQSNVSTDLSSSISDLLDSSKKLPESLQSQEFEAVNIVASNDNVWNSSLSKSKAPKTKFEPPKPVRQSKNKPNEKKPGLSMAASSMKALRNPRKALVKTKSTANFTSFDKNEEALPDLETILLEKSRGMKTVEIKKVEAPADAEIKNSVDNNWLNRNSDSTSNEIIPSLSSTTSFGLSNLSLGSFSTSIALTNDTKTIVTTEKEANADVKYHSCDVSDNEYDNNAGNKKEILPISKKRKISDEHGNAEIVTPPVTLKSFDDNKIKAPERQSGYHYNTDDDDDDSDKDPNYECKKDEKSPSPGIMKRKKSLIKRSKEGLSKVTKKILTRGKKKAKEVTEENLPGENREKEEEEAEVNYFVDTDFSSAKSVPRMSEKFLDQSEKLIGDFVKQINATSQAAPNKVIDHKTTTKKEALQKKISQGTLNDNYVRVNLKKKIFVRGKKAFNLSRYKKSVWKSKKKAKDLNDMRGCDGGVLKCFNCGGVGHFAQQCKQKGDNLMPIDAEFEEESALPTLEEAATMAEEQKLLVHSSKIDCIPSSSNDLWKNDSCEFLNKENVNVLNEIKAKKAYLGHEIPDDFLKKTGFLELSVGNKDVVQPYYSSLPNETSKEVLQALTLFGHKTFKNGQEQAILRVLSGMSTLVTLSTGSGKSLCYQLPAYLYSKKSHCITLVISPLVSLMEDQVHGIPDFVNAQCLHTNQTPKQREFVMSEIKSGNVNVLLISPEAIVSGESSTGFGSLLRQLPPIAFACIDEAHCVSQWSHNFRPSYLMICRVLREKLGVKTVLGLTATATLQTRTSIVKHLDITDGLDGIISDTPLPDNLILTISRDENRDKALVGLLRSERFESLQSIIIYCTRREECERIAGILRTCLQDSLKKQADESEQPSKKRKRNNWLAEAYHAGLPASRRRTIQNAFMSGDLKVVVATIAFGMGINKSDIRGIIHYNMPKSFESFVQEVGRAGRDGKLAQCHAFLDSKGADLSELRRHIYANSVDRHVIRKLLQKVFIPCACKQREKSNSEDKFNMSTDEAGRVCKGHEVCFSIEQTIQALDIPQENIATLLCYLELHEERYVKLLGNAYTMCKIISYSGLKYLKQAAKTCPPLAMALALELKNGKNQEDLSSLEFCVIDVASAIGWDSGIVKYQLKQLEWTTAPNGSKKRSPLTVTYSDLGFRIRSPGDLDDEELDHALDSLEKRATAQESAQVIQLQIISKTLVSLALPSYMQCAFNDKLPIEKSDQLKTIIRNYFQTNLPMEVSCADEKDDTTEEEIIADVRQMLSMYPENNFSGRAISRIFHGISSPCYPAVIWGRCKYWRAHLSVNFHRIVGIANKAIIKSRVSS